jgi:polyisoprenoid-binding protein YceI
MIVFMKDKTLVGGIVVMGVGVLLIGIVWFFFLNPAQTPSAPLVAIPVPIEEGSSYTIFEIVPTESEVAFTLEETLRGLPTTAVGYSQQVVGQIAVDFANPPASKIGPILINARTLLTDNEFRNNAIHSFILDTERYEFITFTPGQISGLPTIFVPDETVSVQIEGDLTIRQITQPVIFTAMITPNGRSQLSGSAKTQISRADFDLQIPNAPGIANVSEAVTLTIDFVAK